MIILSILISYIIHHSIQCSHCIDDECKIGGRLELYHRPYLIIDHDSNSSFIHYDLTLHLNGYLGNGDDIDISRSQYVFIDRNDTEYMMNHQIIDKKHKHRLRKKYSSSIPFVLLVNKITNDTDITFKIISIYDKSCNKFHRLNAEINLINELKEEKEVKVNNIERKEYELNTSLTSSSYLSCYIPFNITSSLITDNGMAAIDIMTSFNHNKSSNFSLYFLYYSYCRNCKNCLMNISEADEIKYCIPGRAFSDCFDMTEHKVIERKLNSCIGFSLCGISKETEFGLNGIIRNGEDIITKASTVIVLEPPIPSLGYTMRTYIGYGILLTILFIFTFFSAITRCKYGPENKKLLMDRDGWEIDECDIHLCIDKRLSIGDHSSVYIGLLSTTEASSHDRTPLMTSYNKVAVKVLHRDVPICARRRFLYESRVLKTLGDHPRIVQMIGAVTINEPKCIVYHYYPQGNLLNFLREKSTYMLRLRALGIDLESCSSVDLDNFIAVQDLYRWSIEIAAGMEYLGSRGIVHRDLCARNVYIDETRGIRIGGFHCARPENSDERHSSQSIKWMAPECIRFLAFSTASDVWSFGVVLYELFTLGSPPYPFIHPSLIPMYLLKGNRLPRPFQCSLQMYSLLTSCWRYLPNQRPSFNHLRNSLHAIALDDANDSTSPFYVNVNVVNGNKQNIIESPLHSNIPRLSKNMSDSGYDSNDLEKEKNLSIILEDEESLLERKCSDHI